VLALFTLGKRPAYPRLASEFHHTVASTQHTVWISPTSEPLPKVGPHVHTPSQLLSTRSHDDPFHSKSHVPQALSPQSGPLLVDSASVLELLALLADWLLVLSARVLQELLSELLLSELTLDELALDRLDPVDWLEQLDGLLDDVLDELELDELDWLEELEELELCDGVLIELTLSVPALLLVSSSQMSTSPAVVALAR
jgi:hypothetical protein